MRIILIYYNTFFCHVNRFHKIVTTKILILRDLTESIGINCNDYQIRRMRMKNTLFLQILVSSLVICSALFAKHLTEKKKEETAPVMAQCGREYERRSVTFSDLAEDITVFAGIDS